VSKVSFMVGVSIVKEAATNNHKEQVADANMAIDNAEKSIRSFAPVGGAVLGGLTSVIPGALVGGTGGLLYNILADKKGSGGWKTLERILTGAGIGGVGGLAAGAGLGGYAGYNAGNAMADKINETQNNFNKKKKNVNKDQLDVNDW